MDRYVDAVCKEIEIRGDYLPNKTLSSVYFGGGTPSLLKHHHLKEIFSAIQKNFKIEPATEITMECNPDDIDTGFLEQLKTFPINRISLGIQSFSDDELKLIARRHNSQKAMDSVGILKQFGYQNISVDLMYSLPTQTKESWQKTIEKALELNVQHISAYSLSYEKGTQLYRLKEEGKIEPISEENSHIFFKILKHRLEENGFEHYEISNFAQKNRHSIHNSGYWQGKHYLGIGASAHSYNGISRQWNVSNITTYCKNISEHKSFSQKENLSKTDLYNEFVFLSLRTKEGINIEKLEALFGREWLMYCMINAEKHIKNNLLEKNNQFLSLSNDGIFVSDGIMSDLMML